MFSIWMLMISIGPVIADVTASPTSMLSPARS